MNAKRYLRGRLGILLALFGIVAISLAAPDSGGTGLAEGMRGGGSWSAHLDAGQ